MIKGGHQSACAPIYEYIRYVVVFSEWSKQRTATVMMNFSWQMMKKGK